MLLARSLRDLGATRVKRGSYECAWQEPPAKPEDQPKVPRALVPSDREELDAARSKLARFAELGMELS